MPIETLYAIPYEKANACKGQYPDGFGDSPITVIKKSGPGEQYRLLRGWSYKPGDRFDIISDQSRRTIGQFIAVGYADPATGEVAGDVPNRKIPMLHVK